jgi:hypothetical protein
VVVGDAGDLCVFDELDGVGADFVRLIPSFGKVRTYQRVFSVSVQSS